MTAVVASSTTYSSAISMERTEYEKHNTAPKSPSTLARLSRKLSPRKAADSAQKRSRSTHDDPTENPTSSTCSRSSSGSQVQIMSKVFNYFDENGDGKISPSELQNCVKTVGGELSVEEAEAAVEASDMDGDGLLGFEEFQKLMEATNDKNKELRDAFKMYEMEGSGCITPTSLRRMLGRLGESRSIDDCKTMIRMFDLNGDGVLCFHEFTIMMR